MKLFLLKFGLFSTTCFVLLNIIAVVSDTFTSSPVENNGIEIYEAIKRSDLPSSATSLVVGDSVSHQLLTGHASPEILSLCTNQAISMCGQYMLAHAALERNPGIKNVVLAYQPVVFSNNLTQNFAFDYFVRPFFPYAKFRAQMWPLAMQDVFRKPLSCLVVFPLFRYTNLLSDTDYSKGAKPPTFAYLSPISIDYLHRLSVICKQRHIHLRIVSTPISQDRPYDKAAFFKEVAAAHLEDMFAGYAETVRLVDPALLRDGVHFKPENVSANSAIFLKMIENGPSESEKKSGGGI